MTGRLPEGVVLLVPVGVVVAGLVVWVPSAAAVAVAVAVLWCRGWCLRPLAVGEAFALRRSLPLVVVAPLCCCCVVVGPLPWGTAVAAAVLFALVVVSWVWASEPTLGSAREPVKTVLAGASACCSQSVFL